MKVFVPGGAGYVGSVLVPLLLSKGHSVVVYDLMLFGRHFIPHPQLTVVESDVRDAVAFGYAVKGCDAVIHLACISNDPGCELNPELAKEINCTSFPMQVNICREAGVKRFIFASSASVYGISDEPNVTENHPRVPISDYNRYKAYCEDVLEDCAKNADFRYIAVRPGTVCGWSPRLRLDLTVNMLTAQALSRGEITVFGGDQYRPNIAIGDICRLYEFLLRYNGAKKSFTLNASTENLTVNEIAKKIQERLARNSKYVNIRTIPSNDPRSYRVDTSRLDYVGFKPMIAVGFAIEQLVSAWRFKRFKDPIDSSDYVNIARYKEISLT